MVGMFLLKASIEKKKCTKRTVEFRKNDKILHRDNNIKYPNELNKIEICETFLHSKDKEDRSLIKATKFTCRVKATLVCYNTHLLIFFSYILCVSQHRSCQLNQFNCLLCCKCFFLTPFLIFVDFLAIAKKLCGIKVFKLARKIT